MRKSQHKKKDKYAQAPYFGQRTKMSTVFLTSHVRKKIKEKYNNEELVMTTIEEFLKRFPAVVATIEPYTANDGSECELVHFRGTVLIAGFEAGYCMDLWVTAKYPEEAPLCFALPTKPLFKSSSELVDLEGIVNLSRFGWRPSSAHNYRSLSELMTKVHDHLTHYPPLPIHPEPAPHRPSYPTYVPPPAPVASPIIRSTTPPDMSKRHSQPPPPPAVHNTRSPHADESRQLLEMRLEQRLVSVFDERRAFLSDLSSTKTRLQLRASEISGRIDALRAALAYVNGNVTTVLETNAKLEAAIVRQSSHAIDYDRDVEVRSPRQAQLLSLLAEDSAIDDAIFALEHAFEEKTIDFSSFVKTIRSLAQRQFGLRALIAHINTL